MAVASSGQIRKKVSVSADVDWLPKSVWKPVVRKLKIERIKKI